MARVLENLETNPEKTYICAFCGKSVDLTDPESRVYGHHTEGKWEMLYFCNRDHAVEHLLGLFRETDSHIQFVSAIENCK